MTVSLVGTGANASCAGGNALAPTKTGVTVGNLVVCEWGLSRGDTAGTALSPPSGWNAAVNPAAPAGMSGNYQCIAGIFWKIAASTTETCTIPSVPTGSYGYGRIAEFSTSLGGTWQVASGGTASVGNNTNATSGNTGTTSSISGTENVVIAVIHPEDQVGNISSMSNPLTSGYTTIFNDANNSSVIAKNGGYKIGQTGTQTASSTWTGNAKCIGCIAVLEIPSSGVTGTVAWSEANDTAALTGTATASGAPSWTEANDSASVTGSVQVAGTASWTEASDTATLSGSASVSGAPSWTEANDSAALTGAVSFGGSVAWTEANDTATLSGTVGTVTTGTVSWTEADDTASLTGANSVAGTASWVEANDASALSGSLGASGAVSWVEANDAASLSGSVGNPSGPISWSEEDDLWTILGSLPSSAAGRDDAKKKIRKRVAELNKKILEAEALEEAQEIQNAVTKAKSKIAQVEPDQGDEDEEEALMLLL